MTAPPSVITGEGETERKGTKDRETEGKRKRERGREGWRD